MKRRGSLLPAVAIGLLVAAGGVALVLDRLWLSAADSELQTAANAAALAAANMIADEEILKVDFDAEVWAKQVRQKAEEVARQNLVAGRSPVVNTDPHRDVRLGRPVVDELTGQVTYIETDYDPSSIMVTAHRDRSTGNPVSLFMPYLTGQPHGDVTAMAEASISNHISGVRPLDRANVPLWPLAILESNGSQLDDWLSAIEAGQGEDNLGWNRERHELIDEGDGLPEMRLTTGKDQQPGNLFLVDLGTDLYDDDLSLQFEKGFTWKHLEDFGSELNFTAGPFSLTASSDLLGTPVDYLQNQIGHTRIVLLYQRQADSGNNRYQTIQATRLVAIRLLAVHKSYEEIELIVQPTVIATRTAVLAEADPETVQNKYIYRIALTQ